jgi:glucose-6-phosphate isomerase
MKKGLTLDLSKVAPYLNEHEVGYMEDMVVSAHNKLHSKTGAGSDFLGWVDLPVNYDKDEFARIKKAAEKIQSDSDALIVIGIGGSYLGARAAIEMLTNNFYNALPKGKRKTPAIFYVGNNISSTYMADLLEAIEGLDISVNVISKSGTTTEPAIAFRIFKDYMEKKYGKDEAKKRIYATTDKSRGALKSIG